MGIRTDFTDIPLAIIGMGCRLPGAEDLARYWELISQGRSAIAEVPAERLDQALYYHPDKGVRGKTYSKLAGLLPDREFDFERYPVSAEIRDSADPMHLEMTAVAADALRQGGLDPFDLPSRNAAVYIGHAVGSSQMCNLTFASHLDEALSMLDRVEELSVLSPRERQAFVAECRERLFAKIGDTPIDGRHLHCSEVAGTVARAFGLSGSFLALNSACASSLHAMLMGARALQQGRVDLVIAGGASHCTAHTLVLFSAAQAMSSTASRPFDANADGLIMSEGYVAVAMKTLEKALADGDPIQAVVRGLGVATDGRGKSLWAPRKEGQIKAMHQAYRSGVDMAGLQYLECHATATQLGDATELETLGEVLGPHMPPGKQIAITSAKANIGHALEAAGVAGLIKTVLCMQQQTIPPAINIQQLNSKIDWKAAPFYIPQAAESWTAPTDGQPRRAAVNAFGIGGLNMHVVLDEFNEAYHRRLLAGSHSPPRLLTADRHASNGHHAAGQNGQGQNGQTASNGSPATRNGAAATAEDRAIAIVGMGCIFPGAPGLSKFWELLASGADPKTIAAEPRWTKIAMASAEGQEFVGGFINDFQYDWRKHKVPPKQIAEADPLQFMFLEAAEQALADAGYDKKPLDRERCGVMVGTEFGSEFSDQLEMGLRLPQVKLVFSQLLSGRGVPAEQIEAINTRFENILIKEWPALVDETGSFTTSTLASRISKTLDLAGGAVAIDSGSTSGLTGLSICVDMLLSGDNDLMICAAGQRHMGPNAYHAFATAGLLASGNPRSILDAGYDGVVPGEGVGVVVLKRLADARRDGDRIHAVLRSIATARHPSHAEALRMAVERASAIAGVAPAEISAEILDTDERLDASGAELETLAALHASGQRRGPLTITSATAQLGQMGGASGLAALIKASLEIQHGQTSPVTGLEQPAEVLAAWKHAVNVSPEPTKLDGRRLVGVTCWSRGLACHVILEHPAPVAQAAAAALAQPARAAVAAASRPAARKPVGAMASSDRAGVLARAGAQAGHARAAQGIGRSAPAISASRPAPASASVAHEWQIRRLAGGTAAEFKRAIDQALADPAAAWQADRRFTPADKFRLAIVADSAAMLADKLRLAQPQLGNLAARSVLEQQGIFHRQTPATRPQVALVFPGQGSQYTGMLRPLVEGVPAAGTALGEIDAVMRRLGHPTFAELAWAADDQLGQDVWTTQVSMLLADSLMLAALGDRGIVADVVLGHSYGEFVALYAAGAWDFETAVCMTQARCQGIEAAVAGGETGMLATDATPELIEQLAGQSALDLYVANLNAPDQCVVGGTRADLAQLATALAAQGRQARLLAVPGAFHTPLLSSASRPLEEALRTATIAAPRVKFVSTVNNSVIGEPSEIRRNLARQLTTPVRYAQLIGRLAAETPTVFVEVGPGQTLTRLNKRILGNAADVIASDNAKRPGWEPLLGVQALLECLGACGSGALDGKSTTASQPAARVPVVKPTAAQPSAARPTAEVPTPTKPVAAKPAAPQPVPTQAAPVKTAPARSSPTPSSPRPATATKGTQALSEQSAYDNIPHFDATERRREKMRAAGGPAGSAAPAPAAKPAVPAAKPAVPAAKPAVPAAKPAIPTAKVSAPAARPTAPVAKSAAPAAKPAPAAPMARPAAPAAKAAPAATKSTPVSPAPPAPAAKPAPVSPQPAFGRGASNGSTNGSTGHHPPQAAAPTPAAASGSPGKSAAELEAFLINFVVEQTGYPAEVVDLDADLEADLGIDSIKKAQLFGELQEYFDVSALAGSTAGGTLSLDDFTTLRHVLDFLVKASPATGSQASPAPAAPEPKAATAPAAPVARPKSPAPAAPIEAAKADGPGSNPAELEAFLINFVVEQTGYPAEVVDLDADLEADLGIDSIKKAQLFGELQEYFDVSALAGSATSGALSLDDFTTLRHVLDFLSQASPTANAAENVPTAPAQAATNGHHTASAPPPRTGPPPTPAAAPPAMPAEVAGPVKDAAELEAFLINFVVEQTGYPAEVVDLDADLEADLGIDSIKKAQLFGELQEYFDVSALAASTPGGSLSLDDFTTLRHVLDFLVQSQPGAAAASIDQVVATTDPAPVVATSHTQHAPAAPTGTTSNAAAASDTAQRAVELEDFLINFVVEQTGYPAEVVDLDADLEADLGIDSIKKAQLFGELQEYFDVSALAASTPGGTLSLDDFTTLRHVLDFLLQSNSDSAAPARAEGASPAMATAPLGMPAGEHAADRNGSSTNGVYAEAAFAAPAAAEQSADVSESSLLEGTPYDLGWQLGRRFKHEIHYILRHYIDATAGELDELPGQAQRMAPEQLLSADELDELQGLADAVEVPLGNLLAHQFALMADLGTEAGQMVAGPIAAGHGPALHALCQPAPLTGALRAAAQTVVVARKPADEIPHLAVAYLGSVAMLGGVNAGGLAITAYPRGAEPAPDRSRFGFGSTGGVVSSTVVRTILGSAATLDEAVELAKSLAMPGGQGWSALVSHASGGAVGLEFDGRRLDVRPAHVSVATGNIVLPAGAAFEALQPEALAAHLAAGKPSGQGTTIARRFMPAAGPDCLAVVIEPSAGNLWLGGSAHDGQGGQCWSVEQWLPSWEGPGPLRAAVGRAGQDSPPAGLGTKPVTGRFSLEMRESPLPSDAPSEPVWTGQAIVLGEGPTADALRQRLELAGVVVHVLSADGEAGAVLAELEEICGSGPAPHLFLTSACDAPPIDPYHADAWERQYHATMLLPFVVCQKWTELATAGGWFERATIVATTCMGGDFGFSRGAEAAQGGSLAGLIKAMLVEYGMMQNLLNLRFKVIDAPGDVDPRTHADQALAELASGTRVCEVAYVAGRRLVSYAVERGVADAVGKPASGIATRPGSGIRHGSTWIISGGARGITAVTALELGKRFGLKLHLVGSTPLAEIEPEWRNLSAEGLKQLKASVMIAARKAGKPTAAAWQRVEKDLEIDRTLRSFGEAGVAVTYHACDVSDRAALAEVLDRIRQADGPIAGILHGAGVEKSCRFERKTPEVYGPTLRVKVDGAANLMALTRRDPIRHFVLFGSISGRLGGFGQVDYSLANEMACKLLGSYRRARPWVQAVGFHWHAWDGVGMAARPETKSLLEANGALALMPLDEGLAHLVRELAAGTPEPEVMITERHHWEKFAAGMGTLVEQTAEGADDGHAALGGETSDNLFPLLTFSHCDAHGAQGQVTFDPTADRFLLEHRLRGRPLLPVVVGLEALAEAARASSGRAVIGFANVDMVDGLVFHGDRRTVATAQASALPDGRFDCRLTADFHNRSGGLTQSDRLYLEATAIMAGTDLEPLAPVAETSGDWTGFAYPEDAPIHHGPIFRGLVQGTCDGRGGSGEIVALPLADLARADRVAGWAIPSCVLDAAFYACAMHLWYFGGNAVALPRRMADVRLGRLPRDGESCRINVQALDLETGDYDFDVLGEDGALIVQARRFGQVIFARGIYGPAAQQ